jgi:SH3-like domain-containing protein
MYARIQAGENGGANLREEPGYDGKIIRPYNNGTLVQVLSETEEIGGILWMRVRVVSDGTEGWMLLSLLSMATPAPNW